MPSTRSRSVSPSPFPSSPRLAASQSPDARPHRLRSHSQNPLPSPRQNYSLTSSTPSSSAILHSTFDDQGCSNISPRPSLPTGPPAPPSPQSPGRTVLWPPLSPGGRRSLSRTSSCPGHQATAPVSSYEELELFLQQAQEDISAVFADASQSQPSGHLSPKKFSTNHGPSSPPRVRNLLQQRSPPPPRKTSVTSPKRLSPKCPSSPKNRRKLEETVKRLPRRVSAPALKLGNSRKHFPSSRRDLQLHNWSQSFLKDFDAIVQEEIYTLSRSNSQVSVTAAVSKTVRQDVCDELSNWSFNAQNCSKDRPSSSRPPIPPPRTSRSKLLSKESNLSTPNISPRYILQKSQSTVEKFSCHQTPLPSSCRRSASLGAMGASNSSVNSGWEQPRSPYNTYTLPRNRRRVSLGVGQGRGASSPEHPDDAASPCQLIRVGPRLSRSHSLDEAFVPLTQRTYFVPTPLTPAPTPLLKKEKLQDKNRRRGVIDIPPINNLFSERRFSGKESCITPGESICSDSSNDFRNFLSSVGSDRRDLSDYYSRTLDSVVRFSNTNTIARDTSRHGSTDIRIIVDHESSVEPDYAVPIDTALLKPDRATHGRKSEPSLPASFILTHPLAEGRRHTLPNRAGGLYPLGPPAFNTSSWDALPPAEEVEVMEDKPILQRAIDSKNPVSLKICLPEQGRKYMTLPPTGHLIPPSSSPSLNSSLSSLSGLSAHGDANEFDSPSNLQSQARVISVQLHPNVSSNEGGLDTEDTTSSAEKNEQSNEDEPNPITILEDFDPLFTPTPTSSPEPITAKLQLLPVSDGQTNSEILFSVVIPENYKRKKRKVKPKRNSDTCLLKKPSNASECSRVIKRNSTNVFLGHTTTESSKSDESSGESEGNTGFLRYCLENLRLNENDVRQRKLLTSPSKLSGDSSTDALLLRASANTKNKMQRRSWSEESNKMVPKLRSTLSDFALRDSVVDEHSSQEFLRQVKSRIFTSCDRESSVADADAIRSAVGSCHLSKTSSVATQTLNNVSPSVSSCWLSDNVSIDPYASSMAFSLTEDDRDADAGDEQGDDSDSESEEEDGWWAESLSSSPPHTPTTPASPAHHDSSPSLSESLDTLDDLNDESGLGTTSTRPSVSPPPTTIGLSSSPPEPTANLPVPAYYRSMERSTSNLSSEDTGVDVNIGRKVKRTLSSRRAREAMLAANLANNKDASHKRDVEVRHQHTQTEEEDVAPEQKDSVDISLQTGSKPMENKNQQAVMIDLCNNFENKSCSDRQNVSNGEEFLRLTHSEPHLETMHTTLTTTPVARPPAMHGCRSELTLPNRTRLTNTLPILEEDCASNAPQSFNKNYLRSNTIAVIPAISPKHTPPTCQRPQHLMLSNPLNYTSNETTSTRTTSTVTRPTHLPLSVPGYQSAHHTLPHSFPTHNEQKYIKNSTKFDHSDSYFPFGVSPSYSCQSATPSPSAVSRSTLPFPLNTCYGSSCSPTTFTGLHRIPVSSSSSDRQLAGAPHNSQGSLSSTLGRKQWGAIPPRPPTKATSTPSLNPRQRGGRGAPVLHTSATTPSGDDEDLLPPMSQRANSAKEIAELEAVESCKWLRAAGFPQYAQMYEELRFPLDLACAERDHSFLEPESLQALFRRLRVLNRCARIRLDHQTNNNEEESEDEEQQCALSSNWQFQRHSRRWSRVVCDAEVGKMLDVEPQHFKRSGSERIKDGAKAILKRMESMKTKKKKKPSREGVLISGPLLTDNSALEQRVAALDCIELRAGALTTAPAPRRLGPRHRSLSRHTPSQGEDSSSLASDQSQNSTPLFRSRRRRKFLSTKDDARSNASGRSGDSGSRAGSGEEALSDSECSPPTLRHCIMDTTDNLNHLNQGKPPPREKRSTDPAEMGPDRCKRPAIKHSLGDTAPLTDAKDNFLPHYRSKGDESTSPLPSPDDERHSIYDNVPLIICNKSYQDYQQDLLMDSASTSAPEGSGSSECCTAETFESPCPSQPDTDVALSSSAPAQLTRRPKTRVTIDRWHSFNRRNTSSSVSSSSVVGRPIAFFTVGQVTILRKRALLRLTALMENHAPGSRSLLNNWELPKFMTKRLRPPENKATGLVFGLSVQMTHRRTSHPLPVVITDALEYLEKKCMDQVGLFRKPGVRTRIQKLRELIDAGQEVDFATYGAYNVADLVKTFFRDMPEGLFTNKLSEVFLTIFLSLPEASRLEAVQCALLLLPDENREALMTLLTFLAEVASKASLHQMTASNLAVCLAPSLFHLSVGASGSSPLRRKNTSGTPEQKDLHDNKASHTCLQMMIEQVTQLDFVSTETLEMIKFTYLDASQPVSLEHLGMSNYASSPLSGVAENSESHDGETPKQCADWAAYMDSCISALIKEVKEKNRSYVSVQTPDQEIELFYRKVEDDHRLRLWKVSTEVEAPPSELLQRVLRERHDWDKTMYKWRVVAKMDHQSEVFQYLCKSMPPKPTNDFCVLRCWRSNLGRSGGSCALVETSVEHPLAVPVQGCSRGIVLVSRYLIQPCGSGKSRITHISRIDLKGRSSDWYNKVYGSIAANKIARLRDSFKHFAEGPESKV